MSTTIFATTSVELKEAFILPTLERGRIELKYVEVGEPPKLLWKRPQVLYNIEDDAGAKGEKWIKSNLMITLSPKGNQLFVPYVRAESERIILGGTILFSSGEVKDLPIFKIANDDDLILYYGWDGNLPAVVENHGLTFSTHRYESNEWKLSHSISSSLQALSCPSSFFDKRTTGKFMFSDSWQCSQLPTRIYLTDMQIGDETKSQLVVGSRASLLAMSTHYELSLIDKAAFFTSKSFQATENILPLSGHRVVARTLSSTQPRAIFDGLWTGDGDPFADSDVYICDLINGNKTPLGKGMFGLPVQGTWRHLVR